MSKYKVYTKTVTDGKIPLETNSRVILQTVASGIINFLLVAGGGSGGYVATIATGCGGGGAGGYLYYTGQTIISDTYSIVIGNGGTGHTNGQDTIFSGYTAIGGGRGAIAEGNNGGNGGCGGGASRFGDIGTKGIGSQGFDGGSCPEAGPYSAGGGGIGQIGGNSLTAGNCSSYGGNGLTFSIFGTGTTVGGGGGGGCSVDMAGGSGGGGTGRVSGNGDNGTPNTGGGGGGSKSIMSVGGTGGSGVFYVRYVTSEWGTCTGGTKSTSGIYTIHKFTSSGDLILA